MGRDAAAARLQVDALRELSEAGLFFEPWADSLAGRSSAQESQRRGSASDAPGAGDFLRWWVPLSVTLRSSCFWRRAMPERARRKRRWLRWMKRWPGCTKPASVCSKQKRTGCAVNCSWPADPWSTRAPIPVSLRLPKRVSAVPIAVARRQEARWWELRAAVSLCRLLKERNGPQDTSRAEAHQMLAEVYGRFTEGFEMPDMREARALLAEVSQSQRVVAGS